MPEAGIEGRHGPTDEEVEATGQPKDLDAVLEVRDGANGEQSGVHDRGGGGGGDVAPVVIAGSGLEEIGHVAELELEPGAEFVE